MTVYISRHAITVRPRQPAARSACGTTQAEGRVTDPPLLTYVWRQLFEQRARESNR